MTRPDLKTILAILILSCLLCLSACSTFLPPTLEDKSVQPEFEGDTPTFPLESLDTPTSLPTLTPTTPPEGEAAYPEPGSEAVVAEEAVTAEEAVSAEATEAIVEESVAVVEATEAVVEETVVLPKQPS